MSGLQFTLDTSKVDDFLDLAPKKTSLAVLRAVKRGGMAAHTAAARVVSRDIRLKVGTVKKAISLTPPNARTLTATLAAGLKRIPLIKLGAKGPIPSKGKGRGVSYRSKLGSGRLTFAFIATMESGHTGVFKRKGRTRLHIQELFGASIGRVFDIHRKQIAGKGADVAGKELSRLLDRTFGVK